jgi:hypothetical protein
MKRSAFGLVLIGATLAPCAALAEDYPYTGYFTQAAEQGRWSPLDIRACALSFFDQKKDGTFIAYHADLGRFQSKGELRFVIYQRGHCSYDAATKLERCATDWDTEEDQIGKTYSDIVLTIGPEYLHTTGFNSVEEGEAYAAGTSKEGAEALSYFRCPFDQAVIAKLLSKDESTLTGDERDALASPKPSMLIKPVVRDLMDRLRLVAP